MICYILPHHDCHQPLNYLLPKGKSKYVNSFSNNKNVIYGMNTKATIDSISKMKRNSVDNVRALFDGGI